MSHISKIDHLFRHEYGQLVALLVRRFGIAGVELIEDAVQWSMVQAIDHWHKDGIPDNPSAWLYKVAHRFLLSEFRSRQRQADKQSAFSISIENLQEEFPEPPLAGELSDALLRMLFVTCNDAIPPESQLVFTLKSLCGFSIKEASIRLYISEDNAYKRFSRAKLYLKNQAIDVDHLSEQDMKARLNNVYRVLYLMFTEGYLSSHVDHTIRQDLCEEATRLLGLLADSRVGDKPDSYALLALMYFNLARLNARQDDSGLLLLAEQDRGLWSQSQISLAVAYLQQSAQGERLSRYHLEASIAAEHCLAGSFEQTRWHKIVDCYQLLEQLAPSPMHSLNKAIALAEWQGAAAGLQALQLADIPSWLAQSYHWYAVVADLQYRCGDNASAARNAKLAIQAAPSHSIRQLLRRRLQPNKT
ncbi:RNA polymerase sigma factor [Agarivorans sp. TSD2052]|uniref:RNA polymerase sigma factor n=1 Tax=Agarivorans sp. TSD2052 TaxID=2937286 RepID=UPI0021114153|nr:DUF6596 domain-containing protein [Agarivorans sp. TSD2052]